MRIFHCQCGQRVFFDSSRCLRCSRTLGFDPGMMDFAALDSNEAVIETPDGRRLRMCANHPVFGICNWLAPDHGAGSLCESCAMNEVIPNLDVTDNREMWMRMERAKRRLLYGLRRLRLPYLADDGVSPMRFRFLEDQRRNPDVFEAFVLTGHAGGAITINLAEADDVHRHAVREQMHERYRTLLGHFRHESGHYFYSYLVNSDTHRERFKQLFGDPTRDYTAALEQHYREGPPPGWHVRHISAYAAAHPLEDWAESFAHCLHICDGLETAAAQGVIDAAHTGAPDFIERWVPVSVLMNEMNRSLGAPDPYPFVLTPEVREKISFVHGLMPH